MAHPRTRFLFGWLIQDPERGALPILRAATDGAAVGGDYFGPDGWREFTGRFPVRVATSPAARDEDLQRRLWAESERLTKVHYTLPAASVS